MLFSGSAAAKARALATAASTPVISLSARIRSAFKDEFRGSRTTASCNTPRASVKYFAPQSAVT